MTYSYNYCKEPAFNNIGDVNVIEMPQHQFIGEHDILTELTHVWDDEIKKWVKNPKVELIEIYSIDVEKRPLQRVENNKIDWEPNDILEIVESDPFLMYEVGKYQIDIYEGPRPGYPQTTFTRDCYCDAFNSRVYDDYDSSIKLNGSSISVNEIERTSYHRPGKLSELKSGNGVLVNISYQLGDIKYSIEDIAAREFENENVNHYLYNLGSAIKNYEDALSTLSELLEDENITPEKESACRLSIKQKYTAYIIELVKGQEEDSRRRGEIE